MSPILTMPVELLPTGRFLYPVCTDRETFRMMLDALYRAWAIDEISIDVITDFLNAQVYLGDIENLPCGQGCTEVQSPIRQNGNYIERLEGDEWVKVLLINAQETNQDYSDCSEEDCMSCCIDKIRLNNGILEYRQCGEWYPVSAWKDSNGVSVETESPVYIGGNTGSREGDAVEENPAPVTIPDRSQNACSKSAWVSDKLGQFLDAVADSIDKAIVGIEWEQYFGQYYTHLLREMDYYRFLQWVINNANYNESSYLMVDINELEAGLAFWGANKADIKAQVQCYILPHMGQSSVITESEIQNLENNFEPSLGNAALDSAVSGYFAVLKRETINSQANDYIARSKGDCSDCRGGEVVPVGEQFDGSLDVFQYASATVIESYSGNMSQTWSAHLATFVSNNNDDTQRRLSRDVYMNDVPLTPAGKSLFVNVTASSGSPGGLGDFSLEAKIFYVCNGNGYDSGYLVLHGLHVTDKTYATGLKEFPIGDAIIANCGAGAVTITKVEVSFWSWVQSGNYTFTIDKLYFDAGSA